MGAPTPKNCFFDPAMGKERNRMFVEEMARKESKKVKPLAVLPTYLPYVPVTTSLFDALGGSLTSSDFSSSDFSGGGGSFGGGGASGDF